MRLSQLRPQQSAILLSLEHLPPASRQRLLDLGLTRGTEITMIRQAPLGGPIWLALKGYELAFRKELARHIIIQPSPARKPKEDAPA